MTNIAEHETLNPQAVIDKLGLTLTAVFVPFSRSRNAVDDPKLKDYSLNWRVTLLKDGRTVLTTDYMQGQGHCPSYKQRVTREVAAGIEHECETGKIAKFVADRAISGRAIPTPAVADVLYSLVSDAGALEYSDFEEWAPDYGYDSDSRKAETIYQQCLGIALKLRAKLGETALEDLAEAFQDY